MIVFEPCGEVAVRRLFCFVVVLCAAGAALATGPAPADTVQTHWGPVPPPGPENTATAGPVGTPTWKHLVRVPYYVGRVPVNAVDWSLRRGLTKAEEWGLLTPAETLVKGVRGPLGTFWLPTGSLGEERGLEYGIIGQRPHVFSRMVVLKVGATYSTKRSSSVTLGLRTNFGQSRWFEVGGGTVRDSKQEFYGQGWDSDEDDEAVYRRHLDWVGTSWRHEWLGILESKLTAQHTSVRARGSRYDRDEAMTLVFAGRIPHGYDGISSGVTGAAKLALDTTSASGNPTGGMRLILRGEYFHDTDDSETEFFTLGASMESYLSLGLPQRVLAVKGWYLQQMNRGDDPIVFTRLLNNRDPYKLRGFGSQRFHAQGSTGMTVEYRWPCWMRNQPGGSGLDAYIFGDAGQFFDGATELATDRLLVSGGVGLRLIGSDGGFGARAEIAYGREGAHIRVSAKQLFHFIKASFYDGSEPIPLHR